jgi:RimJ/RimL family protein N-acetyltransferase
MAKQNDSVVFLRGRRVILRPPTKADIPYFFRWLNDPDVNQYLGMFLPATEADEVEWLEKLQKTKNEQVVLMIIDAKMNKPIGTMGIHDIAWKDRRATTGAVIGEKSYWGKGYGTEAKMLLLNYAFNTLNLRKIASRVYGFNKRSRAYSEKCGYKVEAVLKREIFKNGRYHDLIIMAVFREGWLRLWEQFRKANKI